MCAVKLNGSDQLESITFKTQDDQMIEHKVEAVFIAIGQVPDNKIFENLVDLDKNGYIISDEKCLTKTAGLFVAGDCRTKEIRQVATAIGDGATCGTIACKYLNTLED